MALAGGMLSPVVDRLLWTHATLYPARGRYKRRPYTLLTHAFHHASPLHCAMNCFALWSFGDVASYYLRPARFLALYTAAAVAGGLGHVAAANAGVGGWGGGAPALGASGAVLGIVTFVQLMQPQGTTLVFFVLPLKNWHTVAVMAAGSAYCLANPGQDSSGLAHAAHLGGMAVGVGAAAAFRRGLLR